MIEFVGLHEGPDFRQLPEKKPKKEKLTLWALAVEVQTNQVKFRVYTKIHTTSFSNQDR